MSVASESSRGINWLEVLIRDYCEHDGSVMPSPTRFNDKSGARQ
jgi:hypothetical protein